MLLVVDLQQDTDLLITIQQTRSYKKMNITNITNAQYINNQDGEMDSILATIDGMTMSVPIDSANRHYAEILRQVESGELTIADAE